MLGAFDLWREFRLCRLLRCTPTELEDQSAVKLDWFLQFDGMLAEIQDEENRKT